MNDQQKLEFLQTALKEMFDKDIEIKMEDDLYELGIDSLDTVELIMYYEEKMNKQLPDANGALTKIKDLINLM